MDREQCARVVRVGRVHYSKVMMIDKGWRAIAGRDCIGAYVRDIFRFPLRIKIHVPRVAR